MPSLKCLGALVALVLASPAVAKAPKKPVAPACIQADAMMGKLAAGHGTLVPLTGEAFTRGKFFLAEMARRAGKTVTEPADAWLVEMSDASGGILFAAKGCVIVLLQMTPQIAMADLKKMLFSEKVSASPKEPDKEHYTRDEYGRVEA